MLDIKFIRQYPDKVKEGVKKKGVNPEIIDKILKLDEKRKEYISSTENLRAEQNKLGRDDIKEARKIKAKIIEIAPNSERVKQEFNNLMLKLPNLPLDDVPVGKDENDNKVIKEVAASGSLRPRSEASEPRPLGRGLRPKFDFKPKNYLEIAESLDLIDIKRASKVSGTRFGYLKNEAVLFEFALIRFVFDTLIKEGFVPIIPPIMIKPEMMEGMGYLIKAPDEGYFIEKDNLYLVGTSEQSVGPMHSGEVFEETELPKRYICFSTCFRREAGAYGKDTKGILRVHQFDKIEMLSFSKPEDSKKEHKLLLKMEEKLMNNLKLPYRVVQICTADMAFPTAAQYDIETWLPGENCYRETHSTSNCTDFQARRLNIRYRNSKTKKLEFAHTLNGTAFAVGRILIAIIENYQKKNGSVEMPKILQRYLGFKEIKKTKRAI